MKASLCLMILCMISLLQAGQLRIDMVHNHEDQSLRLHSLRYKQKEVYSVTRLSYLLSNFSIQRDTGEWVELKNQYAYIDEGKRRTRFFLKDVPEGSYKSIRFALGVPKATNHADPAQYSADHPLNPNLNQLHWNWSGGYIFLALEGRYRAEDQSLQGFVYHLANDNNFSTIQLPGQFVLKQNTGLILGMDIAKLLGQPRALSFIKDGSSTHSHAGDPIASSLIANLQSSFSLLSVTYPKDEMPTQAVTPLYLPEKYTPYRFAMSRRFPRPALPRDNPLLEERVALGKKLFHDTRLSRTNAISCASCHHQERAFTDGVPLSLGVEQRKGKRNSMPLFNLAWKSSFFWDGRADSLRMQALMPIQDHLEMDESLENIVAKLGQDASYQEAFQQAFSGEEINSEKISLALECFLLTLTSYDSKFDRAMAGKEQLTEQEQRGMKLFFTEYEPRSGQYGADCFHCHGGANFSDHQFHNNGLKPTADLGRYAITQLDRDKNSFSTPSLRNVALTAPYMHDGRFSTLEEVIDHYSGPMHRSENLDPNLAKHPGEGLQLSDEDKAALVAFLKTLSDPKYTTPR
ncbi:Cytochrome c peroxidase [Rubritalea squalenifaciens DSM 18772]|uniref:Cytochrome c peroxidase n=1 Tax=Rubritalea squalenifaciens DSM 18772 TaxID=1123071 RepID=A0A1M6R9F3_9BACT|nr:MbnP family protein [Rubritalea squalenifaciens]SHK28937.1 Cytochrome c peroxidase [Rubritalea squalenifaciens DSM 18772]